MVTGMNTAYRCQDCGAAFLRTHNGQILTISDDQENAVGAGPNESSKPMVRLKKLLGFSTCPQCGGGKVFKDLTSKT